MTYLCKSSTEAVLIVYWVNTIQQHIYASFKQECNYVRFPIFRKQTTGTMTSGFSARVSEPVFSDVEIVLTKDVRSHWFYYLAKQLFERCFCLYFQALHILFVWGKNDKNNWVWLVYKLLVVLPLFVSFVSDSFLFLL